MNTNISVLQRELLGGEPTAVELHSYTNKWQEDQQWVNEKSIYGFERARVEQVRDLLGDQQIILTTTLSHKW
ncbi:hypothetical protein IEQ34_003876 [Dendrobium chrysotoxum]|uniref:Uncharacterized protein n=1 Tax=Dendrobium chrysotoxum TaxID=161865 RepID=A0AAV7HGN5_DENCH|nr:hypothetical protein IEQ34_003876 [Dendrobium chrysotoxum]